jgi:predicted ATPase/DNA-binding SARP family transcriptional activator
MEFSVLGPLEVRAGGRAVPLGGAKPRGVLAFLLLHAGEPVSADRLARALWGDDASASTGQTVQVYVSRLRRALGAGCGLLTTPAGYLLRLDDGELDLDRFERLVAEGRRALADDAPERAAAVLDEALSLWRGSPLGDLGSLPFAAHELARLEEQRLEAVELSMQAGLAAGRHAELVPDLRQLAHEHPWREQLHAHLMLALYRSGRQADALEAYRRAREVLVEELGIEPGAELAELHAQILAHDPVLAAPALAVTAGGLPTPPNRTIGREQELARIVARLHAVRLLTLTGPGGVGKTRLAIDAARSAEPDFADGARFVSLAAQRRAEEVPMAIVGALGATLLDGESAEQAVERFLSRRHLLLVVDNCEHVLGMAHFLGRVLESCPRVTVLATSREPLALQAEERRPVPPLPTDDAATLFAVRARAHDPELDLTDGNAPAVADICRRVDGLPLAVELAAARCALLSPAEIARRLDAALGALGPAARDAPARHQTLRATIDWSHELLTDDEKACFASFAVFSGGATVGAAEAVTGAQLDILDRLVAKSLLVRSRPPTGDTRLSMLETVRAYAADRFGESAAAAAVRARHYRYFRALAERHGSERALWGPGFKEHFAALDADVDNLHAALEWAVGASDAEAALALCGALGCYWLMRDRYADAVGWIERAEAVPGAEEHPELVLVALWAKVRAVWPLGRSEEQPALLDRAEALARSLGDPALLAQTLEVRAKHDLGEDAFARANAWADEALYWAKRSGDDWIVALAAECKAEVADTPEALRRDVPLAAELLERAGNAYHLADLLASSAYAALCHGDDEHARALVAQAIPLTRALDSPYVWMLLSGNAGLAALFTGHLDEARDAFREELAVCRQIVVLPFASEGLAGLAAIETVDRDLDRAAHLCGAAGAHRYGQPVDTVQARLVATYFDRARARLGPEAWDAAVREGAALSWDEAVAYGLEGD